MLVHYNKVKLSTGVRFSPIRLPNRITGWIIGAGMRSTEQKQAQGFSDQFAIHYFPEARSIWTGTGVSRQSSISIRSQLPAAMIPSWKIFSKDTFALTVGIMDDARKDVVICADPPFKSSGFCLMHDPPVEKGHWIKKFIIILEEKLKMKMSNGLFSLYNSERICILCFSYLDLCCRKLRLHTCQTLISLEFWIWRK